MPEKCILCDGDVTEERYHHDCEACGARYNEDDSSYDAELRDVWVEVRQVGEEIDDSRDPRFDNEKEVIVSVPYDDTWTHKNKVKRAEYQFSFREQDEVGVFGAFIHGDIHGRMVVRAKRVRVSYIDGEVSGETPEDEDLAYVEASDTGDFRHLCERY